MIPSGNVVGVWEQDRWSGGGSVPGGLGAKAIATAHSSDGGTTWSTPVVLPFSACFGSSGSNSYDRGSDPWVSFAGSGAVVASALAFSAVGTASGTASPNAVSAVLASRSTDGGVTWSSPAAAVMLDTNPSNASNTYFFNDRDSITADPASGNVYLVWDRLSTGVNASNPAWLAISSDGGATWPTTGTGAARVLYDPGASNEAFNNEIAILPSGTVLDFFTLLASGKSTLQVISSTDRGVTWSTSPPVTVATITSVGTTNPIPSADNPTPIRDSSMMAQIAVDPASGAVAAVWQQSFTSSSFDGIALSISTDGGKTWSAMKQVNGATTAAAFSPTVRYLPGSVLAITYYDLRNYTAGSTVLSTGFWLSESSDSGATWHELRQQSPFDLNKAPLADSNFGQALFLGDNQGLALVGSNPLPLYAATNSSGAHVYATQSPSPLTSSTAHVYTAAAALRPVPAAAAMRAAANVERMLRRGGAAPGPR
ncbi:MAG: exo-alpha-sialidase [Burkholderiaceae bacterium]|nr:exo-alpha-sialidase [Burkholderiaceae bacterium]